MAIASLSLSLLSPSASFATDCAGFAGGDGTSDNPYQITNVAEFKQLENCQIDKHFKIIHNIDFGGNEPGTGISNFRGQLDGNGKTLSNLFVNTPSSIGSTRYLGVFEQILGLASIQNLEIDGLAIDKFSFVTSSGFVGKASGDFDLSDLRLKNVQQHSTARRAGGLIGEATLSSSTTLEKIDIESSLRCGEFKECGGLVGRINVQTSSSVIDRVHAKTYFDVLSDSDTGNLSGGLIGYVLPEDGFPDLDLTIQNTVVSLTNDEPQKGGTLGGVLGRVDSTIGGTTLTLTLDRISIGGVIPDATYRAALAGILYEGGDTAGQLIYEPKETVIAGNFDGTDRLNLIAGLFFANNADDNDEIITTDRTIFHDTTSTQTGAHIVKIDAANKSAISSYTGISVTDTLIGSLSQWYVQAPDTEGTADGSGEDGFIGSVFDGYPVPMGIAETGFLGNRFYFQPNFENDDGLIGIGRLGYANGGAGIDTILSPFSRDDAEFLGWSDTRDGSGNLFEVGEAINGFDGSELFAIWQDIYEISFLVQGVSGVSGKPPAQVSAKPTFVVPGRSSLYKEDHEFVGWVMPRSSTVYEEGETVTATSDLTLIPVFKELFDVSFNDGGADSGSVSAITDKLSITVPTKGDLVRADYQFAGWQDQDGIKYSIGETINLTKDLTFTAQWDQLFDVTFNGGGADIGSVAAQTDQTSITAPGRGDLSRSGYEFAGWGDADGNSYTVGQTVNLTKDLTLTAQWNELPAPAPAPAPVFMGPVVTSVDRSENQDFTTAGLETVTVKGLRLSTVNAVIIGGITVEVSQTSYSSFSFVLPSGLAEGIHELTVRSRYGTAKYLNGLEIKPEAVLEPGIETESEEQKQKVNAGSFKGYVAVYALGHEGSRLSAKIGRDWVVIPSIPSRDNNLFRVTDFTGAGVDIKVRIYIDRVLMETIPLTTK